MKLVSMISAILAGLGDEVSCGSRWSDSSRNRRASSMFRKRSPRLDPMVITARCKRVGALIAGNGRHGTLEFQRLCWYKFAIKAIKE
jgi:hypothetical protein